MRQKYEGFTKREVEKAIPLGALGGRERSCGGPKMPSVGTGGAAGMMR